MSYVHPAALRGTRYRDTDCIRTLLELQTSTAVQTDEPEDPSARLLEIISTLKREKEELDRDISTVLARNTDLEMETSRLKKQKEALSAENEKRVSENARLKVSLPLLRSALDSSH